MATSNQNDLTNIIWQHPFKSTQVIEPPFIDFNLMTDINFLIVEKKNGKNYIHIFK